MDVLALKAYSVFTLYNLESSPDSTGESFSNMHTSFEKRYVRYSGVRLAWYQRFGPSSQCHSLVQVL